MFDLGIYTARVSNIQRPRTKPDIQRTHISKSPAYRLPHFSFQEYILTHFFIFFIFYSSPVVIYNLFLPLLHPTFGLSSVNGQTPQPIVRNGLTDVGSALVGMIPIFKHRLPCIMVLVQISQEVTLGFHRIIKRF